MSELEELKKDDQEPITLKNGKVLILPKKSSSKFKDLSGEIRGRLTLVRYVGYTLTSTNRKHFYYKAQCECGSSVLVRKDDKDAASCGCIRNELNKVRRLGKPAFNLIKTEEKVLLKAQLLSYKNRYDDGDISFSKFLELSQNNCYYCGTPPNNKIHVGFKKDGSMRTRRSKNSKGLEYKARSWGWNHPNAYFVYNGLDRIDQSAPHNECNVVVCCVTCNMMKRNMSTEQFLRHAEAIVKNEKSRRT